MKLNPVKFLFFLLFLPLVISCKKEVDNSEISSSKGDSLEVYATQMRNSKLDLNERMSYSLRALKIAEEYNNDNKTTEILAFKSYLHGLLKEYDEAIKTRKILGEKLSYTRDTFSIADNFFRIGYFYLKKSKNDSAIKYFHNSKIIFEKLEDSLRIGQNLAQMAMAQSDLGMYPESDKNATRALELLGNSDPQYLTSIYNCIAISSSKQKDFKEAIYWYDKAIAITKNDYNKLIYLNNKSNSYRELRKFSKSITILEELLKDSILINNPEQFARVTDNLAYAKWKQNSNYNAFPKFNEALTIRLQENDTDGLRASYSHLSDYFEMHDKKKANQYAIKMLEVSKKQNSPQDQLASLKKIINYGIETNINQYFSQFVHLKDSIYDAQISNEYFFAKLEYDSQKNRDENLQLKINATERKLDLEKEKNKNIITIATGGTILTALIFFIYNRREKYKIEKRKEVYKTEKRIAKKVHDEVANNVVSIMNNIQYAEQPKKDLLDDLEKVYLLTRNISRTNNSVETGTNFDQELKTLITSFNSDKTTIILKDIHEVALNSLQAHIQIELYRIVQELMVNMKNHSKASLVAVSFKKEGKNYFINYSDNGVGMDFSKLKSKSGISNMETRINSISGRINFETNPGKGLKVFIRFKK
jgi:signal transduction histidine kinase